MTPVSSCKYMEGTDKAVLMGGTLHVSEQLEAQIRDAKPEELEQILGNLKVLSLPTPFDYKWPMPVFEFPEPPPLSLSMRWRWNP